MINSEAKNTNTAIAESSVSVPLLGECKSKKARLFELWKEYGYLLVCFAVPAVIMYLIYLAMEIHPFGDGSVLVLDLNGQYVSFYEGLRNFVYGDMSLLYSFCRALGGEFMGMYAYYLASPFSYIVALFPQSMILEALLTIFLLKTGFCGFTFGFYLHQTSKEKKSFSKINVIVFSSLYALSSYCVVQQHNSMWIDAVMWLPIITYGIEELIKKGHFKVYIISLSISILSNFYLGWMTCIYCAIYFFVYYFMHNENYRNNPYREKTHFAKSFLRMVLYSIIGVAISGVIILTAYYSLTFGKTSFSNTNWEFAMRYDLLDMMVKFLPNSYDTVRPEGLPFVYCGVLTILLIPVYFCSARISTREKILSAVLIAVFLLSFAISPVDIVWHGFQKPNWLNYRYSFMLCFIMLVMAHKGIMEIKRASNKTLIFTSGLILLFVGIAQKLEFETFVLGEGSNDRNHTLGKLLTLECVWLTVLCVLVYLIVLCVMRRNKKTQNISFILVFLVSLELFANGLINCLDLGSDVVYTSYSTYHNIVDPLRATVNAIKDSDDSFYRLEEIYHRKANDNMALNVYGMTSSTSTLNATTIKFIQNMGYLGKSHESRYYGGNAVGDSLLGIKYVLAGEKDVAAEYRADKELLSDERYYSSYYSDENNTAYLNLYALSLAYAVNPNIAEIDLGDYRNPYDRMNAIITAMLGSEETIEIFKPIEDYSVMTTNITTTHRTPISTSNYKFPFTNYAKTDSSKTASVKFEFKLPYIDTPEEDRNNSNYDDDYDYDEDYEDSDEDMYESKIAYQYVYFYLPSEFQREFTFVAPSGSYGKVYGGESMRSLFVGKVEEGSNEIVSLTLESDNLYVTEEVPLFYYLDHNIYIDVMEELAKEQLVIDKDFSDDHITGTITTSENNSAVFTSIPYDKGWIVKVDGKQVETYGILGDSTFDDESATDGALVAFNIENAGEHSIELIYRPKAFVLGALVSVTGVLMLAALIIFEKTLNRFFTKFLFPLTVPVSEPDEEEKNELEGSIFLDAMPMKIAEPIESSDSSAENTEETVSDAAKDDSAGNNNSQTDGEN